MSWNVPEDKLSIRQQEVMKMLCDDNSRKHWLQGCAGSGKTLVLLHAMERLAIKKPNASICFITFTHALKDLVKAGLSERLRSRLVISTHTDFLKTKRRYDHVFLDEVQDIRRSDLASIAELAGTLQIAGDPDQKIYGHGSDEAAVNQALQPKRERLVDVFRLSNLLKRLALSILPQTRLVEGRDKGAGPSYQIKMVRFDDEDTEALWMFNEARACAKGAYNASAILLYTHAQVADFANRVARGLNKTNPPTSSKHPLSEGGPSPDYTRFNQFWKSHGVPLAYLGNGNGDFGDSQHRPMVFLMTYHSAKGLDFESVFMPQVNDRLKLYQDPSDPDSARRLLYVAVTRSRARLYVSYTGSLHPLLRNHPPELTVEITPKLRSSDPAEGLF